MILCVYTSEPNFPASDQGPAATRYYRLQDDSIAVQLPAGATPKHVIDATASPTLADVLAFLSPPPPSTDQLEQNALAALNGGDLSQVDLRKLIKSVVINFTARVLNAPIASLTAQQLQTERARIAAIYKTL